MTKDRKTDRPTKEQVREHYKAQGYEVRIDNEGHVFFRKRGHEWQEGRWVSEYRLVNGSVVLS